MSTIDLNSHTMYEYDLDAIVLEDCAPETRPRWAQAQMLSATEISHVLKLARPDDNDHVVVKSAGTVSSGRRWGFNDLYKSEVWINGVLIGAYTY